nr:hypothetical protein [Tanacetum cinerariifolium]
MTLDTHNWSSSAHQELHKILKDEIFPIINQVNARVQNFEIQFLKEAAKFVGDFKSLAKEADESLAKHKTLELEIERLLRAVKIENENVELEFQVLNYAKENAHLKTTYKNLFDSIFVTRTQTKTIIDSLKNKLHDTIYENAKLRAQLFNKVSDQKDTACDTSANTKFAKQSILRKPPKVSQTHALSKPVTSNSIPTPQGSKVMKSDKVIASGMFRINPFKPSRKEKHVPNKDLLRQLDREDLNQLWALVKEYLSIRPASNDKEMELWVELKRIDAARGTREDEDINIVALRDTQPLESRGSPLKVVPTARRLEMPLPGVCTAIEEMIKKLPVKDRWQLH